MIQTLKRGCSPEAYICQVQSDARTLSVRLQQASVLSKDLVRLDRGKTEPAPKKKNKFSLCLKGDTQKADIFQSLPKIS